MAFVSLLNLFDKVALSMEAKSDENILCLDSQSWFV